MSTRPVTLDFGGGFTAASRITHPQSRRGLTPAEKAIVAELRKKAQTGSLEPSDFMGKMHLFLPGGPLAS